MKKNTLSAILMTLFLFISCNNSGKGDSASTKPVDESAKGPNLIEISKKITDSNAFVLAVKEVETLLSSIDELAKAIGQKIDQNNGLAAAAQDKNTSLLAGAYAISTLIKQKLEGLQGPEGLKTEIENAKKYSAAFTKKLTDSNASLGVQDGGATNDNAKKAILRTNGDKTLGVEDLEKLFKSVESLSKVAKEASSNSVKELTSPVVAEAPKKP
ncbi:Vsp/OspC family lipoprotein [Borreliella tanukii]|uniref:Vsp/OspC family lipoprotein n=1 Tax=Borreliella tanukii TaxID=56146 RepID=UPI002648FE5F|nr:Vsp/OspC family lipoprotein [Borreliella tanukii]WKC79330.1 Vsp/OspC family lipoprotein [Borreliella tanukii]